MRYLLLSDVHSNLEALDACLQVAEGKYETAVCLGDIVGYGPNPNEVIEKIRHVCRAVIRGNHDKASCGIDDAHDFNPNARIAAEFTRQLLSPDHLEYLRHLPSGPAIFDGFMVVHGSPRDEDEYIVSSVEALPFLRSPEAQVVCFGHTHLQGGFMFSAAGRLQSVQFLRPQDAIPRAVSLENGARYLLNPGSVGQPRDYDWRAAFAILDTDHSQIEFYRTAYDVAQTQAKMEQAGLPPPLYHRLSVGR